MSSLLTPWNTRSTSGITPPAASLRTQKFRGWLENSRVFSIEATFQILRRGGLFFPLSVPHLKGAPRSMQSTIMKQLQDGFLESYLDIIRQDYLKNKQDIKPAIIGFEGSKAWVMPFCPRDNEHKKLLLLSLAGGFAVKKIKRYAYVIDSWNARIDLSKAGYDESKMSEEEKLAAVQKLRQELPESLADYVGRMESMLWGMVNEQGPEFSCLQLHDSSKHEFTSPARLTTKEEGIKESIFHDILKAAKQADLTKLPFPEEFMWAMICKMMGGDCIDLAERTKH